MPRLAPAAPVALPAVAALLSPTFASQGGASLIALLVIAAGILEIWPGFGRAALEGQRAAWVSGGITIAMGALIANAATLAATGIVVHGDGSKPPSSRHTASSSWPCLATRSTPAAVGGRGRQPFTRIHDLLKRHGVPIAMAGDAHDFEYDASRCPARLPRPSCTTS